MKAVKLSLHEEIRDVRKEVTAQRMRNEGDHEAIMSQIMELVSDKKALRLFGIILGIALGSIIGAALWFSDRISDNSNLIKDVRAEERGNARQGFQIAEDLRKDVSDNEEHINELRKLHRLRSERD